MNDIEATKKTGFKVCKLPTELCEQNKFTEDQKAERCNKLLGIHQVVGNRFYL